MKSMFILSTIFSATMFISSAFAESSLYSGAYAGGGLTYSTSHIDLSNLVNKKNSASGLGFNAFAGYGHLLGKAFYLGGEINLGIDGSKFKNADLAGDRASSYTSKSFVWNISTRLGAEISNLLIYGKLGYEGREDAKDSIEPKGLDMKRSGILFGAGFDVKIHGNLFLRLEDVYNFGQELSTSTLKIRTYSNTFLVGAGYKF